MSEHTKKVKVFKFGGASVKTASAVRNVAKLIQANQEDGLLVVVSAMGKTTNLLESIINQFLNGQSYQQELAELRTFHQTIISDLIGNNAASFFEVDNLLVELECILDMDLHSKGYDYAYDQIICFGELISTRIISRYLHEINVTNRWLDARNFIVSTEKHRSAKVIWAKTHSRIVNRVAPLVQKQVVITQGFIAKSENNRFTSLGREGSDYSAAIFASGLDADEVVIWKDVPGVMNADPKRVNDAVLLPKIAYREAIELAYYGASVIHPKTLQPLQRKNIPLHVKSFLNADATGTCVAQFDKIAQVHVPCYIFKPKQTLIQISTTDLSFIVEDNLSEIFESLSQSGITVNLMQNTAVSFSICVNEDQRREQLFFDRISDKYEIKSKNNLDLLTVFNPEVSADYSQYFSGKRVYLESGSTNAIQFILQ